MKILDRYILFSYIKTFVSVFVILMFIFVLQTIWLYIAELAGKDLDAAIIIKFLWFVSPRLMPLVLPLTILVSSLMVFGSLAENYEFAAMKSSGISLQRAMGSLTFFILALSLIAFFFANNVIPYSEYKWKNLRRNISQVSPSMAITEGQFSSIGDDFTIKVAKKSGENGQYLDQVVIHSKHPVNPNKNSRVIVAEKGEIVSQLGSNMLSLVLSNGNYYDDIQQRSQLKQARKPFVKSYFDEYTFNIDISKFNDIDIEQENDFNDHSMFTISELRKEIDSLSQSFSKDLEHHSSETYFRTGMTQLNRMNLQNRGDTIVKSNKSLPIQTDIDFFANFTKQLEADTYELAINNVKGTKQAVEAKKRDFIRKTQHLNKHRIALYEKYVLAVACIVLFFVGAPLGAIIRKGGMGLPMVVAISLFLSYHFIGIFAKNSATDGTLNPMLASWLSTLILLPLGVWLTIRATSDQGIFDTDAFIAGIAKPFKYLINLFNKKN